MQNDDTKTEEVPEVHVKLPTLDVHAVAALLNVSTRTVWRWVKERSISYRRLGHRVRFTEADIDEFVRRSHVKAS